VTRFAAGVARLRGDCGSAAGWCPGIPVYVGGLVPCERLLQRWPHWREIAVPSQPCPAPRTARAIVPCHAGDGERAIGATIGESSRHIVRGLTQCSAVPQLAVTAKVPAGHRRYAVGCAAISRNGVVRNFDGGRNAIYRSDWEWLSPWLTLENGSSLSPTDTAAMLRVDLAGEVGAAHI